MSFALALGAGGARGIAHIVVLEILDDLGVRPDAIAGTSMGAIVGAAYAAGLTGKDLRAHAIRVFRDRTRVMGQLMKARVGRFVDVLRSPLTNPVLIDAEQLLEIFWPPGVPSTFEDLSIPLTIVTTDFDARCECVFREGPLAPAVAGSMAIPGLVRPVRYGTRTLVDGGAVNPLPYEHLMAPGRLVAVVDVSTGQVRERTGLPSPTAAMFGAAQIMQIEMTRRTLSQNPPDLVVRPPVDQFRVLEFFRAAQILRATDTAREEMTRGIAAMLETA